MLGPRASVAVLQDMGISQQHRGPDSAGYWASPENQNQVCIGHTRLGIIDLSDGGHQPMHDPQGRWTLTFNGEIYNYKELRQELNSYPFQTNSDGEVLLAAFATWGMACFEKLIGMFACVIWDAAERRLIAVRDRFGVKPLYHASLDGTTVVASEIKAFHAAGVPVEVDATAWGSWLGTGTQDFADRTFWKGIRPIPAGHALIVDEAGSRLSKWYDFVDRVGFEYDDRDSVEVMLQYTELIKESVGLRFRSDVPVGIAISGGLDSAMLLAMVDATQDDDSLVTAYTFTCGNPSYDELPWVNMMLRETSHPLVESRLRYEEIPELASDLTRFVDEPFGGVPTLALAKLCERARSEGVVVLLGGEGMDEQWAGYDYYESIGGSQVLQASVDSPIRPQCLAPEFLAQAAPKPSLPKIWDDDLRNKQYFDLFYSKIPRTTKYNDRLSMRVSLELREPFLDHRLVELAFRQPKERKLLDGKRKVLLRQIGEKILPDKLVNSPKRPVQTPQREWLSGPLRDWCHDMINVGLRGFNGWIDPDLLNAELIRFERGESDNSYYVWQWISMGLMHDYVEEVSREESGFS